MYNEQNTPEKWLLTNVSSGTTLMQEDLSEKENELIFWHPVSLSSYLTGHREGVELCTVSCLPRKRRKFSSMNFFGFWSSTWSSASFCSVFIILSSAVKEERSPVRLTASFDSGDCFTLLPDGFAFSNRAYTRRQSLKKRFEWLFFFPNFSWMLQQYHLSWCRGEKLMIRYQEFFRVWRLWRHSPMEHWLGRTLRAVFPCAEVTSFTHFRLRGH